MKDFNPSAKRIKNLMRKSQTPAEVSSHKKEKNHQYKKTLSLPTNIHALSLKEKKNSSKQWKKTNILSSNKEKISLEQLYCTSNQNYPLFFLKKMGKITSLQCKEKLIAMRNLKTLTYEMQKWIHTHITKEVKVFEEEEKQWRDLLDKREERHFQIDRIIKYLSEI